MGKRLSRRRLLAGAAGGLFGALAPHRAAAGAMPALGPPRSHDFAGLTARARALADTPYAAPPPVDPILRSLDYERHQRIRSRPEATLWRDGDAAFPVRPFHPGRWFPHPVALHVVDDGVARELLFDPALFDYADPDLPAALPAELSYAGFRVMNGAGAESDWLSFLGASYFRSAGPLNQYGLFARGLAIDSGLATPEEFPGFTAFWLEPGPPGSGRIDIDALLDGPSVTGAFRFQCEKRPDRVLMTVTSKLFLRRDVGRLGIAPLTSMFWYAETDRRPAIADWRPEIHDSDGLALLTGAGERLWRPPNNPPRLQNSSFLDRGPRGFGLLQRDRDFEHYQDDGVFYERRPNLWVEPLDDWGPGAVVLVEIPTDDEIHDNIVAFWQPETPARAGDRLSLSYRLHWTAGEPAGAGAAARVVATRSGRGGVPGRPRPPGLRKFVVDFAGEALDGLDRQSGVEAVVTGAGAEISGVYALPVVGTRRWRAVFDVAVAGAVTAPGGGPVELRLFLRHNGRALSETWLYQHFPTGALAAGPGLTPRSRPPRR